MAEQNKRFRHRVTGSFRALIPRLMSNRGMLRAFELLRRLQKLNPRVYTRQRAGNEEALPNHTALLAPKAMIEDQRDWEDLRFGRCTMSYSGCEIIAAFNTIRSLTGGDILSLPELIARFEKDGMVLSGHFGSAPRAVADHLKRLGFDTCLKTNPGDFEALAQDSDGLILTMYNDGRDITDHIHTIAITKEDGSYYAHNAACDGSIPPPGNTITELIAGLNGGRARAICLIGVKRPAMTAANTNQ